MSRLRKPASIVSFGLKMRSEGMGIRASGRVLEKSHTRIMRWEQKVAAQSQQWSPDAPAGGDITIEGDEVYTRVGENLPRGHLTLVLSINTYNKNSESVN